MKTPTPSIQTWIKDIITLLVLFGLFYGLWIGSYALFTPDEGRYSEVAREMIVTHDYITPRLNGVVFLDKPILYYWLQASAIKLFGLKEWALRFWPAFMGVLGCLMTYIAGHLLFNRRTGLCAAIMLATSPLYYGAGHYANLDLEVAVLISCSLLCFISGIQSSQRAVRSSLLLTAYVFAGFAALTKGLIGIVFPAMIIGAWIILLNQWSVLKKMHLVIGLIIFSVIALPWYFLVQKANPEFFEFFFLKQQVSRFLTTEHFNNRTPGWFYLPVVLLGVFPWCIVLFQALTTQVKTIWKNRQQKATELFLLAWIILVFIFFSIPKSKTVGYILPIFPAIALLVAQYLNNNWDKPYAKGIKNAVIAYLLLSLGILIACSLFIFRAFDFNYAMIPYVKICGLIFIMSGIGVWLARKNVIRLFATLCVTAVAALLLIAASSNTLNQKSIKPLAIQIKPHLQDGDEIVTFYKYFQDLPIYLERRITIVADWQAADIPLNDNWVRELWYGLPFQDTKEWLINEKVFWERWNSKKRLFVFTDPHLYETLKTKSKIPVYKIAQYNHAVLISNKKES